MIDAAVIGVGQTKYESKRRDVSVGGLVREAIDNAMKHANVEWDAIDAVILGKAPDMFEGCLLYTSPSPRDLSTSRMPSSA